ERIRRGVEDGGGTARAWRARGIAHVRGSEIVGRGNVVERRTRVRRGEGTRRRIATRGEERSDDERGHEQWRAMGSVAHGGGPRGKSEESATCSSRASSG